MISELTLLNFYAPAINFVVFVVLFVVAFRSVFVRMARQQKADFLRTKEDAERQLQAAEAELRELLYQEQELAKKNQLIFEQAEQDSQRRARQIIADAQAKAAQIQAETKRLVRADYLAARQQLYGELQHAIETKLETKILAMNAKARAKYMQHQLAGFESLVGTSAEKTL